MSTKEIVIKSWYILGNDIFCCDVMRNGYHEFIRFNIVKYRTGRIALSVYSDEIEDALDTESPEHRLLLDRQQRYVADLSVANIDRYFATKARAGQFMKRLEAYL